MEWLVAFALAAVGLMLIVGGAHNNATGVLKTILGDSGSGGAIAGHGSAALPGGIVGGQIAGGSTGLPGGVVGGRLVPR